MNITAGRCLKFSITQRYISLSRGNEIITLTIMGDKVTVKLVTMVRGWYPGGARGRCHSDFTLTLSLYAWLISTVHCRSLAI